MKATIMSALLAALTLAGCQSSSTEGATAPAPFKLNKSKSVEITPDTEEFTQRRAATAPAVRKSKTTGAGADLSEGELLELPKFTVTRKGFFNFGMSVVTNVEVTRGGTIEWMRVGVVLPGSLAARQGLFTGVEILAIDGMAIAHLSREEMLHLLFERESGEQVRLLVYSRHLGPLPRFVTMGSPVRRAN